MVYCKRLLIILLLFFIILSFTNNAYCQGVAVQPGEYNNGEVKQYDNTFLTLKKIQEEIQLKAIARLYFYLDNKPNECIPFLRKLYQEIGGLCLYVYEGSSEGDFYFGFYKESNASVITNEAWAYYCDGQIFELTAYVSVSPWYYSLVGGNFSTTSSPSASRFPSAFIGVLVPEWIDLFKTAGIISSSEDTQSIVSALNKNNQIQQDVYNEVQKNTQATEDLKNSITDPNVDASENISGLPSDNTQDITEDGFNNIFNMFYNTFTTKNSKDLVINIPFTNKSFTINSSNVYSGFDGGIVSTLINAFWYFVTGLYIVKDVGRKINKIKSGNVEDIQSSNVKEDLL